MDSEALLSPGMIAVRRTARRTVRWTVRRTVRHYEPRYDSSEADSDPGLVVPHC